MDDIIKFLKIFAPPGHGDILIIIQVTRDFSEQVARDFSEQIARDFSEQVAKIEDTRKPIVSADGIRFVEEATATRFRG